MSKKNNRVIADDVQNMQHDLNTLSKEDFELTYGIEIREDGKVYDSTYERVFDSVGHWIDHEAEQDEYGYASDDDDYYSKW